MHFTAYTMHTRASRMHLVEVRRANRDTCSPQCAQSRSSMSFSFFSCLGLVLFLFLSALSISLNISALLGLLPFTSRSSFESPIIVLRICSPFDCTDQVSAITAKGVISRHNPEGSNSFLQQYDDLKATASNVRLQIG